MSLCGLADAGRAALRRDRLGLVFQQFNLIPSLNVEDNLVFQSRIAGRHDAAWHAELVERLGLGNLLKRYPEQLSGGQQQRVAIGRALATKPLLLLADEPTGNLDEATADEVLALARDLVARTGCGFLMVTHSARLAATLDRQVNLQRRADRMTRRCLDPGRAAEPLAAASDAACDACDRPDLRDRAVERRAGAEPAGAQSATTAPPRLSAARVRRCWSGATARPFRNNSSSTCAAPAGRYRRCSRAAIQIGGRSFRLLGIEPVTLPAEVGNAPTIGKANLQSFMTPPGRNAGCAGDALRPWPARGRDTVRPMAAPRCRRCACSRNWCPGCWWSISASRKNC